MATATSAGSSKNHGVWIMYLRVIGIDFLNTRPKHTSFIQIQTADDSYDSYSITEDAPLKWDCEIYVSSSSPVRVSVHRTQNTTKRFFTREPYAELTVPQNSSEMKDEARVEFTDERRRIRVTIQLGRSKQLNEFVKLLGTDISSALAGKVVLLDKIGKISDFVEVVLRYGESFSELCTPAKLVVGLAKKLFEDLKKQRDCHNAAVDFVEALHAKLPIAEMIPERMQNGQIRTSLQDMLRVIGQAFVFLNKFVKTSASQQLLLSQRDMILGLEDKLSAASHNFQLCLAAKHYVEDRERDERHLLEKLRPANGARFSDGNSCLPGTRLDILQEITEWREAESSTNSFWAHGTAGTGKSSITHTVCEQLREKGVLAGSFFCKRDIPNQRDPRRVLPSLAYTLAIMVEPYRELVLRAVQKEPDISLSPLSLQLATLFTAPFATLQEQRYSYQPLLFAIDALDECGDPVARAQVADCLCRVATLSSWLKIFITSRPLPELAQVFESYSSSITSLDLNQVEVDSDIFLYTKHRLEMLVKARRLGEKWLRDDLARDLTRKASRLFIWTSTVMEFVADDYSSEVAMDAIVSGNDTSSSTSSLDILYMSVLRNTRGGLGKKNNLAQLKIVLGMICMTARNQPLTIDGLHEFTTQANGQAYLSRSAMESIIKDLRSVLYEDASKGGIIRVCHPSFLDFIENAERCMDFWTDPEQLHQRMVERCFVIMRAKLKFNICGLEMSCVANADIADLEQRAKDKIPECLQYGCLYWAAHLADANHASISQDLLDFLKSLRILYWLEVLSLIGGLRTGLNALRYVSSLYERDTELHELVQDAHRFLSSSCDAISHSTPHLYVSAVTWLPEESCLRRHLYPHLNCQPLLMTGRRKQWHSTVWMNGMGGIVWEVAFSPDGRYVAGCSEDAIISVWDAKTGLLSMRLQGHTGAVYAIAFSPDGRQLASGSRDETVRLWDLLTGTLLGEPLSGHTDSVNSVCYSPDGQFIASRSWDRTIRAWNASTQEEMKQMDGLSRTGRLANSPDGTKIACCGQEGIVVRDAQSGELLCKKDDIGHVISVAYSPNGAFLASDADDGTVRLWNGETLNQVAVLRGHSNDVRSVTFSGDGSELLSGSADGTMIRWNTTSFEMIGGPTAVHEAQVWSAVYSPDGQFIASGSFDGSVRVWDIKSLSDIESSTSRLGRLWSVACSPSGCEFASASSDAKVRIHASDSGIVLKTFEGHTGEVIAVAYNPCGNLLASGSTDRIVIVWSTESGSAMHRFEGHTGLITSVIFAPDGKHVFSASSDGTVGRWNLEAGDNVGEILFSHEDKVESICLSPDGNVLASGGQDKTIRFSNPDDGSAIGGSCTTDAAVRSLAFSPSGKLVASGSEDEMIQLWDVDTRTEVRRFVGHTDFVLSVAFSNEGRHLLSASGDNTIRLWDTETGAELRKLVGHSHSVLSAIYSLDGNRSISASDDGTVRIWNLVVTQEDYIEEIEQELSSLPLVDGWIKSANGDLLLWVPPEYRNGIRDMCEVCIPADAPNAPVRLDWSKLVKGKDWESIVRADK